MGDFSIITISRGILGLISLMFISYLISSNKKKIKWKTVFVSILIQFIVAVCILKRLMSSREGDGGVTSKWAISANSGSKKQWTTSEIEEYEKLAFNLSENAAVLSMKKAN